MKCGYINSTIYSIIKSFDIFLRHGDTVQLDGSIIIEAAAMSNRQKKMGYNAAQELLHKLGMAEETGLPGGSESEWEKF